MAVSDCYMLSQPVMASTLKYDETIVSYDKKPCFTNCQPVTRPETCGTACTVKLKIKALIIKKPVTEKVWCREETGLTNV